MYTNKRIKDSKELSKIRKKIIQVTTIEHQLTERRKKERMPRAIYNRHYLFGFQGLLSDGIVDRYLGETSYSKENGSKLASDVNSMYKKRKTIPNKQVLNFQSNNVNNNKNATQEEKDANNEITEQIKNLRLSSNNNTTRLDDTIDENSKDYFKVYKDDEIEEFRKNPTATNIVDYFGQKRENGQPGNFNCVEYEYEDFALCKYYGSIPNNYMITLRRFPFPVHDNIYDVNLAKNTFDVGRMITWMGDETGNKLEDILKFDYNFVWKEVQSEMQSITSAPASQGLTDSMFGKTIGNFARLTSVANPQSNMFQQTVMHGQDFYDFTQHDPMLINGPVDSIDSITLRDRGLKFEHNFSLNFHYEMKYIAGVNPRIALLDCLANVLSCTFNSGQFWGGGIRYKTDLRQQHAKAIGKPELLQQGRYFDYIRSVGQDFGNRFVKMANSGEANNPNSLAGWLSSMLGGSDISKSFSNTLSAMFGGALNMFFGNNALKSGSFSHNEIPNALLINQPVGLWHITMGNPFQPIAVMGNMILEKSSIQFDNTLGFDDFPTGFTVTCNFKHPSARDKSNIESMFNVGRGNMYIKPMVNSPIYHKKLRGTDDDPYRPNRQISNDALTFVKDTNESIYGLGKYAYYQGANFFNSKLFGINFK